MEMDQEQPNATDTQRVAEREGERKRERAREKERKAEKRTTTQVKQVQMQQALVRSAD